MTDYRYTLSRRGWFADVNARICWVMLNPSTADETVDDPTIRRVRRFSQDAGAAELVVVNLFAARATKPADLLTIDDPVGPDWEAHIDAAMARAAWVVFAWGASSGLRPLADRLLIQQERVRLIAHGLGHRPRCLGLTKNGSPLHPLYVPAAQPLVPFTSRTAA